MTSNWEHTKLEKLAFIEMGQSPPGEKCNHDGIGMPLLNGPTEFGTYYPTPVQFTTDARKIALENDILFCVRGSTTGRMNWADQKYAIGRGIAALRHRSGTEYRYFLKALIDFHLSKLLISATGSTFPNVSRDQLASFDCEIPPLPEQRAIADVLGSLDDKIELNWRMNATLEAIAWALFKHWFVDNPKAKRWEDGSILEFADLLSGGTPSTAEPNYWNGNIDWVSAKDVVNTGVYFLLETEKKITEAGIENSSTKMLPAKTTIVTARGTVGAYCLLGKPMTMNQTNYGLKAKEGVGDYFIYFALKSMVENLRQQSYGTIFDTITTSTFRDANMVQPPIELIHDFEDQASPFMDAILKNQEESYTLASLRDTLLSRLMRGEVRVRTADGR
jgi:type I restriction enzyme S subunit